MVAIGMLHKFGVAGFKAEADFGNVLLATLCFQGATWVLIPFFLRQHQVRWREALVCTGRNLKRSLAVAAGAVAVILPVAWLLQDASVAALEKIGWPVEDQTAVVLLAGAKIVVAQNLSRRVRRRHRAGGGGIYFSRRAVSVRETARLPEIRVVWRERVVRADPFRRGNVRAAVRAGSRADVALRIHGQSARAGLRAQPVQCGQPCDPDFSRRNTDERI